ncbi:MAG: hypothetical protein ACRCS9_10445 [Hyphomicrobium sp.]
MIIAFLRQLAALSTLSGALIHLCIGLKLAVFHYHLDGGNPDLVLAVLLFGFILWATGCMLARGGSAVKAGKTSGAILKFTGAAKSEPSETCSEKVAA